MFRMTDILHMALVVHTLRKKKAAPTHRLRAPHVLYTRAMRNAATAAGNLDSPVMAHSDKVNVPIRALARNL
jgi:hypothetical protein